MSRRKLPEVDAGSMADIAFLLLIFFLVTTTMDSDEGILRQLPPPVPEEQDPPDVIQRNVYVVLVNAQDDLLVEDEPMDISNLKDGAKNFLIANGVFRDLGDKENFPIRTWVRKSDVQQKIDEYKAYIASATNETEKENFQKVLEKWQDKMTAIEIAGEYKELPGSALISMQNDKGTTYDTYIQVQNELESAVNELRDELATRLFGISYNQLEEKAKSSESGSEWEDRLYAVRTVHPQRISEAEPRSVGSY
jgi:biopolymer transport protein ExbD